MGCVHILWVPGNKPSIITTLQKIGTGSRKPLFWLNPWDSSPRILIVFLSHSDKIYPVRNSGRCDPEPSGALFLTG
jgi:hypothetical protein